MSHHLDAPEAAQSGQLYLADLYVFGAEDSTVFVMDVNSTITEPNVRPGFHPEARYEFKVHFDGADHEDLTYRVTFGQLDADGSQSLELRELTGAEARRDSAAGRLVVTGRTGQASGSGGTRVWAGRARDAFYIDLSLLAIVNPAVRNGTRPALSDWRPDAARNSFADTTVDAIVLVVSHEHPQLRPDARIGVWAATKLATDAGGWRQVNRAGHPMMWPIFWPEDTRFTDPVDSRHPADDFSAVGEAVAGQIAAVVAASGTSDDPHAYGEAVARTLFPDVLPYVVGTQATYGFASLNGRTLGDNAPEVMLSLVLGQAIQSGLGPADAEDLRTRQFPFVVATEVTLPVG